MQIYLQFSERESSPTRLRLVANEITARHDKAVTGIDLSYQEAMKFLRGETLTFSPNTPRGIVEVCFKGHPLGTMKNIGTRANNLYPKEWRIKTTHIPTEYEPILQQI
jgi:NOL1/NOP2/fmu family ribosome biogenesis protein